MHRTLLSCCLAVTITPFATAQDLAVGKAAPPLHVAKWVKGDAVAAFQPDHVYVVEFWATWCGPCIASMPHLSEIQAKHADDVTVIGVTSADPNNPLAAVEAMVADKGDGMGYTVAWDDGRKTNDAFMKAAGQRGIPCSFLIDQKGQVAYIGHPMFLDIPLADVLAGDWDPISSKAKIEAAGKRLNGLSDAIAADSEEGNAEVAAFLKDYPMFAGMVEDMQFQVLMQSGKTDKALVFAGKIVERAIAKKDAMGLNEVAWAIVDPAAELEQRDLDLAMKAATKAVAFSKEKDGAILDTLARVWFWKKDYQKALELQQKAVALTDRQDIKDVLAEYEQLVAKARQQGSGQ
jgi:thiol-disulfide isomerase/thioredoxin